MNTELYEGIKARITAEVTAIKHIALYNNQFDRSNNDDMAKNDERPFLYPCVFIEFLDIVYVVNTGLLQDFTGICRLYIGFKSYKFEDLDIFTIKQNLFKKLQGYQPSTSKTLGKLIRVAETMDNNHNNVLVYIQDYKFSGRDADFSTNDALVVKEPPTTLEITATLDIDNNVIRTGDGTP